MTNDMEPAAIESMLMPAVYVRHLAREFADPAAILNGIELELEQIESPGHYITVGQNLKCVENAVKLAESPDWYLPWGLRMAEYIHGPLTPALLTAPTLGDGLDAFLRYFDLRIPYMAFASRRRDEQFEIELAPRMDVGGLLSLLIEIPLLILQHYIGTIRNAPARGARIELGYPASTHHADVGRWFECEVRFGCNRHALVIPAEWRQVANLGHDEALWHTALQKCGELLETRTGLSAIGRIRRELHRAFAELDTTATPPTLERIAERLHLSPRTLIRRLRAAETTFQLEIDVIRRNRASDLLTTANLPIGEIAAVLGFADASSFAKAFKRWFGLAPAAYRKSRAGLRTS